MNIRSLTKALEYKGEVEAKRQTYYIFEGSRHFFVMSFSRSKKNAGNFNLVDVDVTKYVAKRYEEQSSITSTHVAHNSRKPQYVSGPLQALNVLYVLVATGRAKIDSRCKSKQLYFNIRG
jgi:hypothetical protein